jgi:3'(2'), 5'-bisphosphate nucleotidase
MAGQYASELQIAVAAVRQAAIVTQAVQKDLVTADTLQKKDRSPVTVADFASQAVVCKALHHAFPNDPIVGEEDAHELRTDDNAALRASVVQHVASAVGQATESQTLAWIDHGGATPDANTRRFWTLDPIDGTKGFLRGEQYAIALALIENGQVVLGILGCPNLDMPGQSQPGVLMVAVRNQGTQMLPLAGQTTSGQTAAVSTVADPADARFCESVESGHSDQSQSAQIARQLGITAQPLRMDSQVKYAAVARADASIYLRLPTSADYREKIWDHAAGMIVVQEAGGQVTDVHGQPLDFSKGRKLQANQGIIATNRRIHPAVVNAVKQILTTTTTP